VLFPRIIPCLLVKNKGLVKTVQFKDPRYVGDPINAVKIFNEKEVDELIVLDIDATAENREPDYRMVENLAGECRMPLCYGGGIRTVEQAHRIFALGVEKVALSSAMVACPELVTQIAAQVGNQSVVAVLDVKRGSGNGRYEVWTHNGTRNTRRCPVGFAKELERLGIGEIITNSIENDGLLKGYDFALVDSIRESISVPMTVLGGAGSLGDIEQLISRYGIVGAAAGGLFVFKGVYRAVLINYPSPEEKKAVFLRSGYGRSPCESERISSPY